jgi:hydroxymethylglutaryl-CoA reductase
MCLHAKNIAITAGAKGRNIDIVAQKMVENKCISAAKAKEILDSM